MLRNQTLAARETTDVLLLDFSGCLALEQQDDQALITTLAYALHRAAAELLQLDARELGVDTMPAGEAGRGLGVLLYDNAPGGAGHVRELLELGRGWLERAKEIMFVDEAHDQRCQSACLDCLLSFQAQNAMLEGNLNRPHALVLQRQLLWWDCWRVSAGLGRWGRAMDAADLERVYEAFQDFQAYFAPIFGRKESREHSRHYLPGLLVQSQERRNAENLAETVPASARALPRFLTASPWDDEGVMGRLREYLGSRLEDPPAVWVLDGNDFPKPGVKSVGVIRQYCGLDFTQNPQRAMDAPTLARNDMQQVPEGFSLSAVSPDI